MFTYNVDDEVELRLLNSCNAPTLFALVDANRSYLREWLPWLDSNREEQDSVRFIAWSRHQFAESKDIVAGIWYRGTLVGLVGLHGMTPASDSASIGYWLAREFQMTVDRLVTIVGDPWAKVPSWAGPAGLAGFLAGRIGSKPPTR